MNLYQAITALNQKMLDFTQSNPLRNKEDYPLFEIFEALRDIESRLISLETSVSALSMSDTLHHGVYR